MSAITSSQLLRRPPCQGPSPSASPRRDPGRSRDCLRAKPSLPIPKPTPAPTSARVRSLPSSSQTTIFRPARRSRDVRHGHTAGHGAISSLHLQCWGLNLGRSPSIRLLVFASCHCSSSQHVRAWELLLQARCQTNSITSYPHPRSQEQSKKAKHFRRLPASYNKFNLCNSSG